MNTSEFVPCRPGDAWNPGRIDHREARLGVAHALVLLAPDEHVPREQAVPGLLGDHADWQPVFRVGAREAILDEELFPFEVAHELPVELVEMRGFNRAVDLAPPDVPVAR